MPYDITQPIGPDIPVWPGDTAYRATRTWSIGPDCPVNVSKLEMSTHTGTHADAPFHYREDGKTIAEVAVSTYLGPCRVIDVSAAEGRIGIDDLGGQRIDAPRILLRTFQVAPAGWPVFAGIDPALIDYLARQQVILLGVDAPSIDPETSKTLDAHRAIDRNRMAILEGLVLHRVVPGRYDLVALPLPLTGLDAAPVRAVLLRSGTLRL
jgi:arylformamidase